MHNRRNLITTLALALLALALAGGPSLAQTSSQPSPYQGEGRVGVGSPLSTGFTYQGQLKQDSNPVTSTCDFQFGLYDDASLGTQLGVTQTVPVSVTNGLFAVQLNGGGEFGTSAFNGDARWLAIAVRCPTGSGSYTSLGRQALTAAPYALYSNSTGALQGRSVASTAPGSGQVLKWNGSAWAPAADADTTYTAGDGLELTGTQFKAKGTPYQNVVIVAKSGGDYTSVQAALTSITDASDTNRYLVWVAPGVYTETVTMKPYVDIEGAGELLTMISYTGSAAETTGTVVGASNAELRFLTVRNTGGSTYAKAIFNNNASPRLTHVTASASGGSGSSTGVFNASSSPVMTNVTASASGGTNNYGVFNVYSSSTMTNVTATASGGSDNRGVYNYSSSSTMTNVTASASGGTYSANYGAYNYSSSPTMMDVTATASGSGSNYGMYNYVSSSPTMTNVTATASGGGNNIGVYNAYSSATIQNSTIRASGGTGSNTGVINESSSSPTIHNCTISASGGTQNIGVNNLSSSSPTIQNCTISASGGTANYGVYNDSSSATIQNCTISASGGTINTGVYNYATSGSYTVQIDDCQVTGSTNTISNDNNFTTRVGASLLDGGTVYTCTGTCAVKCAGCYDENYTFYASTCP